MANNCIGSIKVTIERNNELFGVINHRVEDNWVTYRETLKKCQKEANESLTKLVEQEKGTDENMEDEEISGEDEPESDSTKRKSRSKPDQKPKKNRK